MPIPPTLSSLPPPSSVLSTSLPSSSNSTSQNPPSLLTPSPINLPNPMSNPLSGPPPPPPPPSNSNPQISSHNTTRPPSINIPPPSSSNPSNHPSSATQINNLLNDYASQGGSNSITMFSLRSRLSSILPFSSSIFGPVFSEVGRCANAIDAAAQRQTYPVGGPPPDPSIPLKNSRPFISPEDPPAHPFKHPLERPSLSPPLSPSLKKSFRFQAPRPDITPVAFSPSARLLLNIILEYKDDIKSTTKAFIVDPHKPPLFPNAMV